MGCGTGVVVVIVRVSLSLSHWVYSTDMCRDCEVVANHYIKALVDTTASTALDQTLRSNAHPTLTG